MANVLQRETKNKFQIIFVDLEPATINKEIFTLTLFHTKVKVKELHKRKDILQYLNCQVRTTTTQKKYCSYQPRCVHYVENDPSTSCSKSNTSPAKFSLCKDHPSNYKCYQVYKDLQNFGKPT